MVVAHDPIDLRQEDRLVTGALDDSGQSLNEGEALRLLRRRDAAAGERRQFGGRERREEGRRIGRCGHAGEVALLLVVAEEEEQAIAPEGAAQGGAELLPAVLRF